MKQALEVVGFCRPRGEYTLVGAVELIRSAVEQSRDRGVPKLLINGHEMSGVPIPSLIDRFLMVEEWPHEAQGMVAVALVVHEEYIHPEKFGVAAATHFGLKLDVFSSETDAFTWISNLADPK
ncbi:MAG: hypothetical protein E6H66_03080 [Betaproteobacteria bacterium]|nr:MAG: hypothetical protein E6H66_03080 [Betaproteobacteria bacterium]